MRVRFGGDAKLVLKNLEPNGVVVRGGVSFLVAIGINLKSGFFERGRGEDVVDAEARNESCLPVAG